MEGSSERSHAGVVPERLRPLVVADDFASGDEDSEDEYDEDEDDSEDYVSDASSPDQCGTPEEVSLGLSHAEMPAEMPLEMPADLEKCLALNRAYRALLESAIGELAERLEQNRLLQRELPKQLTERVQKRRRPRVRKNWYNSLVFHHPYFRDVNGMRAPMNEDERAKRANKEMDPYLSPSLPWTTKECHMLCCQHRGVQTPSQVDAVQANLLHQTLDSLMNRKDALAQKLAQTKGAKKSAELTERIKQLDEQMAEARNLSLEELLERSSRPIDWLRIAAVDMRSHRTAFGCEMQWCHLLDVRLNRDAWTPAEDERLRALAAKWDERDWDKVAEELNTGRSAYQCAAHYSSRLVTRHNMGLFSKEENHRLQQLIHVCTEGDDISWAQVAHFMGSRSMRQVMNHYKRSMHPEMLHGPWAIEEDIMLLMAMQIYGEGGWPKVATLLPCRTAGQCRDHYKDHFAPRIMSGLYTPDEDYCLLQLVQKHGVAQWSKVAEGMPWRTADSSLARYRQLSVTLGTKHPTVADLQRTQPDLAVPVSAAKRARFMGLQRRQEVFRRIIHRLCTPRLRHAALMIAKGQEKDLDRETCLMFYRKMLRQYQTGCTQSHPQRQAHALNKAISQYAQTGHRPTVPNLAAYEHQEWQAVANVLHNLHGLPRPPVNPDIEEVGTLPTFEEFFSKEVVGVPDGYQPNAGNLVLPLLPPNETTVATFGRLLDRFANGDLANPFATLKDGSSFAELSAAFDAESIEDIRCTECSSRSVLEDGPSSSVSREASQQSCSRCEGLRATRRNYEVLQARFLSYFFWPALIDAMDVSNTVELPVEPPKIPAKCRRGRHKMKKPWVKEKWKQRKRLAAERAAARACAATEEARDEGGAGAAPVENGTGVAAGAPLCAEDA
ncbi:snRNA-activating protein complex subunit 4-like isoform X1 [Dermacentor albipictus]|uniref:snRNA-activating protein complex subunit 4-like isoform X1 n=1 Tax=Dermacentor albipictus TaxID=60249 RepID=UPI0038FC3958